MAQTVVSCPGCGKKFRVAEDAAPGKFQCTQCGGVVTYGGAAPAGRARPATARPARARPARTSGSAAGPARSHRGGRGNGSSHSRARGGYHRDPEEGPPSRDNTALYAILGVVVVVVIAAVIIVVATSGNGKKTHQVASSSHSSAASATEQGQSSSAANPATASATDTNQPGTPVNPSPAPGATNQPASGSPSGTTPAASGSGSSSGIGSTSGVPGAGKKGEGKSGKGVSNVTPQAADAPTGGLYGKSRTDLRSMKYSEVVKKLDYLSSTSSELRARIDHLYTVFLKYDYPNDQQKAMDELIKIGRPAIPRVLSAALEIHDFGSATGGGMAYSIDYVMRQICGDAIALRELAPMVDHGKPDIARATIKAWYVWWYSKGSRMSKYQKDSESGN